MAFSSFSSFASLINSKIVQKTPDYFIVSYTDASGTWTQYWFTKDSQDLTLTLNDISSNLNMSILTIGGGGGGGASFYGAGGGGGGGFVQGTYILSNAYSSETITVNLGKGGQGQTNFIDVSSGNPGSNTTVIFTNNPISTITAYGGGGGLSVVKSTSTPSVTSSDGASGGGPRGQTQGVSGVTYGGLAIYGNQGYNGATNTVSTGTNGGGGGGAGGPGLTAIGAQLSGGRGGAGGVGRICSIPGISTTYYWGGGGGGGSSSTGISITDASGGRGGGAGGWSNGAQVWVLPGTGGYNVSGRDGKGAPNTGGGGGGGSGAGINGGTIKPGGNGGSGIVIISLLNL